MFGGGGVLRLSIKTRSSSIYCSVCQMLRPCSGNPQSYYCLENIPKSTVRLEWVTSKSTRQRQEGKGSDCRSTTGAMGGPGRSRAPGHSWVLKPRWSMVPRALCDPAERQGRRQVAAAMVLGERPDALPDVRCPLPSTLVFAAPMPCPCTMVLPELAVLWFYTRNTGRFFFPYY